MRHINGVTVVNEVARDSGAHPATVKRWCEDAQDDVTVRKLGGTWLITIDRAQEFIRKFQRSS